MSQGQATLSTFMLLRVIHFMAAACFDFGERAIPSRKTLLTSLQQTSSPKPNLAFTGIVPVSFSTVFHDFGQLVRESIDLLYGVVEVKRSSSRPPHAESFKYRQSRQIAGANGDAMLIESARECFWRDGVCDKGD